MHTYFPLATCKQACSNCLQNLLITNDWFITNDCKALLANTKKNEIQMKLCLFSAFFSGVVQYKLIFDWINGADFSRKGRINVKYWCWCFTFTECKKLKSFIMNAVLNVPDILFLLHASHCKNFAHFSLGEMGILWGVDVLVFLPWLL